MSAPPTTPPPDQDPPEVGDIIDRLQRIGAVVAVVGIVGAVIGALVDYQTFIQTYLYGFTFWIALPLGGLTLLMIQHLVRGRWGALIRRLVEAGASTAGLFAVLFIPIALSMHQLFPWLDPRALRHSEMLRHKALYLNQPFFLGRAVLYFAVWIALAFMLRHWSLAEDRHDAPKRYRRRLRVLSASGLVAFAITDTFASIDWIQSLEPHWYSSLYPMMVIIGQFLTATVVYNLLAVLLSRRRPLSTFANAERFNDLGNIMLVFVVLWGYTEFIQLVIIWSGDTAHKITWYLTRSRGGWGWVIGAVVVLQFFGPLLALFFRHVKRAPRLFAGLCAGVFAMRMVDVYWLVIPAFKPRDFQLLWQALANWAAIGGLWLVVFGWLVGRAPLMGRSARELFTPWRRAHGGD